MENYITALLIVTIIGIVNTIYLTYCCITQKDVKCFFLPAQMCMKVQYSKYSRTMGIPNPYMGLAMLSAILMLTFLFMQSLIPFWLIFAIVTAGFLFSLYFLCIQAFILKAFCQRCVPSAIVFSILFYISV